MGNVVMKAAAALIGLVAIGIGAAVSSSFGSRVVTGLNKDYRHAGWSHRYPPWWHRLMGTLIIVFGVLVLMAVLFHLQPASSN